MFKKCNENVQKVEKVKESGPKKWKIGLKVDAEWESVPKLGKVRERVLIVEKMW
jgi:hypothetical protein